MGTQTLTWTKSDTRKLRRARRNIREGRSFWTNLHPVEWGGEGINVRFVADDYESCGISVGMLGGSYATIIAAGYLGHWVYTLNRRFPNSNQALLRELLGNMSRTYIPKKSLGAYIQSGERMSKVLRAKVPKIRDALANVFGVDASIVKQSSLDPDLYNIGNMRTVYVLSDFEAGEKWDEYKSARERGDFFGFEMNFFQNHFFAECERSGNRELFSYDDLKVYSADEICSIPPGDIYE